MTNAHHSFWSSFGGFQKKCASLILYLAVGGRAAGREEARSVTGRFGLTAPAPPHLANDDAAL